MKNIKILSILFVLFIIAIPINAQDVFYFENYFDVPIVKDSLPDGFTNFVNSSLTQPSYEPKECFTLSGEYGVGGKKSTDQSAKVTITDSITGYNNIYFEKSFPTALTGAAGEKITIEYELMPMDTNASRYIQVQTNGAGWGNLVGAYFVSGGRVSDATNGAATTFMSYEVGKWSTVAIVCTIGSNEYDIYIDGAGYKGVAASPINSINLMRVSHNPLAAPNTSVSYWDNFRVYPGEFDYNKFLNDVSITSDSLTIDDSSKIITNLPENMTCEQFKAAISLPKGASIEIYNSDKLTPASGLVNTGMYAIVTSKNGSVTSEYLIVNMAIGFNLSLTSVRPGQLAYANVTVSDSSVVSGVEFFVNDMSFGSVSAPPYKKELSFSEYGDYKVYAEIVITGGVKLKTETKTITCLGNILPVISLDISDDISLSYGDTLSFTASATDDDGTVTNVSVYVDDIFISRKTLPPYSFSVKNILTGNHIVWVTAEDNEGGVKDKEISVKCSAPKDYIIGEYNFNGTESVKVAPAGFSVVAQDTDFSFGTLYTDEEHLESFFMGSTIKHGSAGNKGYFDTNDTVRTKVTTTTYITYDFMFTGVLNKMAFGQIRSTEGKFNDTLSITDGRFTDGKTSAELNQGEWYRLLYVFNVADKKHSYTVTDKDGNTVFEKINENFTNMDFSGNFDRYRITLYGNLDGDCKLYLDNYKIYQIGEMAHPISAEFKDAAQNVFTKNTDIPTDIRQISLVYSEDLNEKTITNSSIKLDLEGSLSQFDSVSYNAASKTIVFKLSVPLSAGVKYNIVNMGGIKDLTGNSLPIGSLYTFKTKLALFDVTDTSFVSSGEVLSDINDAYGKSVGLEVSFKNDTTALKDITVIMVIYQDNKMISCELSKKEILPLSEDKITVASAFLPINSVFEGYILDSKTLRAVKPIIKIN